MDRYIDTYIDRYIDTHIDTQANRQMEYFSKIIGNICIFTRNLTHRICPSKDISFHPTELPHETSATSLVAAAYHNHPKAKRIH